MASQRIIPLSDLLDWPIPRLHFHLPSDLSDGILSHHSFSPRYVSDHRFDELPMLLRHLKSTFCARHVLEPSQLLEQDQERQFFWAVEVTDKVEGDRRFMNMQQVLARGENWVVWGLCGRGKER